MPLALVLPAIAVPLALVATVLLCRQVVAAAQGLHAELHALRGVLADVSATRDALTSLDGRRHGPGPRPR